MTSQRPLAGGCQCGAVRFEITAEPEKVYICHCTECRRQSASAFGISVIARCESVKLIEGDPKCWSRPTSGGNMLDCYFCPECGTRLWHRDRNDDELMSVKGGTLDQPIDLSDASHIWVASKIPGIVIPNHVPTFPGEPD